MGGGHVFQVFTFVAIDAARVDIPSHRCRPLFDVVPPCLVSLTPRCSGTSDKDTLFHARDPWGWDGELTDSSWEWPKRIPSRNPGRCLHPRLIF